MAATAALCHKTVGKLRCLLEGQTACLVRWTQRLVRHGTEIPTVRGKHAWAQTLSQNGYGMVSNIIFDVFGILQNFKKCWTLGPLFIAELL